MDKEESREHETLARTLNDPVLRAAYAQPFDEYKSGYVARLLGGVLILSGGLIYGRQPSYAKFKAIEVIARIPYQSWEMAVYTLLTAFYTNEQKAIGLAKTSTFSRMAQDNETMHVVVLSQIVCRLNCEDVLRHTLIPFFFSFLYFWTVYVLYLFSRRAAFELNYLFEAHAYAQYSEFLEREGEHLKQRPITSDFLAFYGREVRNEYELFELIRNDELIHRNRSIRELQANAPAA